MKKLLIFYGWPNDINGASSSADPLSAAESVFGKYDYVVLGAGIEDPGHGAHADTIQIMANTKTSKTIFFGYVDLGVSSGTSNFGIATIKTKIDQWISSGADGIFLDDFGYDYGVSRDRQNEIVNYAHSKSVPIIANAWSPEDVFGSIVDATYNTTGLAPTINANDFYLAESYQVGVGAYIGKSAWQSKVKALKAYQKNLPFKILAITTNDSGNSFDSEKFAYAWYSSLLYDFEACGWGEYNFASGDNSSPWRSEPTSALGSRFTDALENSGSIFKRKTDAGYVYVDSTSHDSGFVQN